MERVKKGEDYWYLSGVYNIERAWDNYGPASNLDFVNNNYFHTKEEAEVMARKIKAVLDGADVIEIPSEEECICSAEESNLYEIDKGEGTLAGFVNGLHRGYEIGFLRSIEWFKSKIVK